MTYDPTSVLHDPKVKFVAGIIIKRTYFDIQQRMFALKREERKTSQNKVLADITIKFRSIIIIQQSTCSQCFLTKLKKIQHGGRPIRARANEFECACIRVHVGNINALICNTEGCVKKLQCLIFTTLASRSLRRHYKIIKNYVNIIELFYCEIRHAPPRDNRRKSIRIPCFLLFLVLATYVSYFN